MDNHAGIFGLDSPLAGVGSVHDEDIMVIAASGLFNEPWYIAENPDVARSGINPLLHYVLHGASEGRAPFKGFNAQRYLTNAGQEGQIRRNPLAHYILHGSAAHLLSKGLLGQFSVSVIKNAMERLAQLPIYDTEDYLTMNEDIRPAGGNFEITPLNHALVHGFPEGRSVFMKTRVARVMGAKAAAEIPQLFAAKAKAGPVPPPARLPPVGVYYNSRGNAFIREIAEDIVTSLQASGQDAALFDETADTASRRRVNIFVAPHEFFHLEGGRQWATEEILREAFLFTTEQPQTLWFERGMPYVLMARGIIDISWQVAEVFKDAGMKAIFFNPNIGPCRQWLHEADARHPLVRILPKAQQALQVPLRKIAERPIDVAFFGGESEYRERFFSRHAGFFAQYQAFLYYRKVESPLVAKGSHAALSRIAGHVGAHSKISLNIHRDSSGFFEWHRIAKLGMVGGSVVVSEPCPPHPVFKAGVHFLEESGRHILNLIEWLIKTPDGQAHAQNIQDNGQALVNDAEWGQHNVQALVKFIHDNMEVS